MNDSYESRNRPLVGFCLAVLLKRRPWQLVNSLVFCFRCNNSLIDMGACTSQPCLNGGSCFPLSDGLRECECPLVYEGESCEHHDPCAPVPCKNKGQCSSNDDEIR